MIVINTTDVDGKWFDYDEDTKLFVRPFRLSLRAIRPGDDLTSVLFRQARYCLTNWEGIKDSNGNEVKFTEENRDKILLDFNDDLTMWVNEKSAELSKEIVNISKKKI